MESRPPLASRAPGTGIGWRSSFGWRGRAEALAEARLEFAEALCDDADFLRELIYPPAMQGEIARPLRWHPLDHAPGAS